MNPFEVAEKVAAKVAGHLDGYAVDEKLAHHLHGRNGARLVFISVNSWQPRVQIIGSLPTAYTRRHYGAPDHRITVSAFRTGEAIAAEITRRLLPAYVPSLGRAVLVAATDYARDRQRHARARRIALRLGDASIREGREGEPTIHAYQPGSLALSLKIRLSTNDHHADITIQQASPEVVDAVVDALSQGDTTP